MFAIFWTFSDFTPLIFDHIDIKQPETIYFSLWNNLIGVDRDFKSFETDKRKLKDFNTTKRKFYTPFDIF